MSIVQPDLFGDYDRAEKRAELWNRPATCPSCGTEEANGFGLRNNHGYEPGEEGICGWPAGQHPNYGAHCVAQHLTANHVRYYAHGLRDRNPQVTGDFDRKKPFDEAACRRSLDSCITRARELGVDTDAILAVVGQGVTS